MAMNNKTPPSSPLARSPISSPLPPSLTSSPLPPASPPSSPQHDSPPSKRRTWQVYNTDSTGWMQPSRSTQYNWAAQQSERFSPPQPCAEDVYNKDSPLKVLAINSAETRHGYIANHHSEHHDFSGPSSDSETSHSSISSGDEENHVQSDEESLYSESLSEHEGEPWFDVDSELDSESDDEFFEAETDDVDQRLVLYEGCENTVDEAVLDILENHIKSKGTRESLDANLSMFNKYIPKPNLMPKTLYQLLKYVKDRAPSYEYIEHLYCAVCFSSATDGGELCQNCHSSQVKKFYSLSIESQLRSYFEKCKVYELFKTYQTSDEGLIRDICDGEEYKRLQTSLYRVTLMMNTDGISLSHSSKTSLYPLQYIFCELPPELRRSFIIVCGVWCDSVKPPMNLFLRPFVENLQKLYSDGGFTWKHPDSGQEMKSVVLAPLVCADAPVRAQLQNIMGHNAKYACNTCEQKSQKVPLTAEEVEEVAEGKRIRRTRALLFQEEPARFRSGGRMVKQASQAHKKGRPVKGVKGPAVLALLTYLNLAFCVYGEYMHLVCLGVVRHVLNLWINVPGPWNIKHHMKEIDQFLCNIKPPNYIGRLPRGVSDMKHWKASEFRAWLLFYSLPTVLQFLPSQYSEHWSLLVMAIYLLLKEEIKPSDVDMSETMIRLFLRDIGNLYRYRDYVYNVHELQHLPVYVRRWGPLWATSAFMLEDYNGDIAALIHGTKNKAKELINSLQIAHGVEVLRAKVRVHNINQFNHQGCVFKALIQCRLSGLTACEQHFITSHGVAQPFSVYCRVLKQDCRKEVFTSMLYTREKKRNNFTIFFYKDEAKSLTGYGEIKGFVLNQDKNICALIYCFKVQHVNMFFHADSRARVSHIVPIIRTTELLLIPCSHIISKVIKVGDFLCHPPNWVETNNL